MFAFICIFAGLVSLLMLRQVARGYGGWYAIWAWLLSVLLAAIVTASQLRNIESANLWLLGAYSWLGIVSLGALASSYVTGLRFELPETRTSQFLVFALSLAGLLLSLFGIAGLVVGVI